MKCVENFALSYIFPTCMKFIFLSSDGDMNDNLVCAQIFFIQVASKIELFQCENIIWNLISWINILLLILQNNYQDLCY